MNPQPSLMSQLSQQMVSGGSPMNVQTPGSPGFNPQMQTPSVPNPNRSGGLLTPLHHALARRGIDHTQIPQLSGQQPSQGQPSAMQPPPTAMAQPAQQGATIPVSETELILKSFEKHLSHRDKLQAKVLEAALPQEAAQASGGQA
jgi:hypothetical protein